MAPGRPHSIANVTAWPPMGWALVRVYCWIGFTQVGGDRAPQRGQRRPADLGVVHGDLRSRVRALLR